MSEDDEALRTQVVNGVYELLNYQLSFEGVKTAPGYKKRLNSHFSLGYIYGFVCCAAATMDIVNEQHKMLVIHRTYEKLFGKNNGPNMVRETYSLLEFDGFQEGKSFGWQEFENALANATEPTGLVDYLKDEIKPENPE